MRKVDAAKAEALALVDNRYLRQGLYSRILKIYLLRQRFSLTCNIVCIVISFRSKRSSKRVVGTTGDPEGHWEGA